MFGPNDFRPSTSSSKMLGGIPGLNAQQELTWARASRKAKDYIEKAKEQGKDLVKRTPDGSLNNFLTGLGGAAKGINAVGGFEGLGDMFGGGDSGVLTSGLDFSDAFSAGKGYGVGQGSFPLGQNFDLGITSGSFKSGLDWNNSPFSW